MLKNLPQDLFGTVTAFAWNIRLTKAQLKRMAARLDDMQHSIPDAFKTDAYYNHWLKRTITQPIAGAATVLARGLRLGLLAPARQPALPGHRPRLLPTGTERTSRPAPDETAPPGLGPISEQDKVLNH